MSTENTAAPAKKIVMTFDNHPPVRMLESEIWTIYDAGNEWGHRRLKGYQTKAGKWIYWSSYNSGMHYSRPPRTARMMLKTSAAIKSHFGEEAWHSEIQEEVEPESIIDLTV